MAIVFSVIALTSIQFLLGHAVNYVEEGFKNQWTRTLTAYYMEHQSWENVQDQVSEILESSPRPDSEVSVAAPRGNERFYVFDANQTIVASSLPQEIGKSLAQIPDHNQLTKDWTEIVINGNTVGYFWVDAKAPPRQNRLTQSIGKSIIRSMLIGLILTTLLALLLGSILTGRLTGPLKELTSAVRRVGKGELSTHLEVKGQDDIAMLGQAFNQMTEQLVRNEDVRRNMVADIAHELRTPLTIISGKLESIQEGVLPMTPETLLTIQDETIRLRRLVQDLQQLSLAEAGKLPMHQHNIDLYIILERIFEQFAFEFEERGIQGELRGQSQVLQADPDRLTQVFVNIIGNALLHTSSGEKITVTLDEAKRWIRVTVEDTGVGIPSDELEHVFDRFYRVDQSRDRETGGTGLGLAIAKEFVQAHGGEIEVRSELGRGTCFSILLPTNREDEELEV